jgi:ABC-type sugar transport system permease subunit
LHWRVALFLNPEVWHDSNNPKKTAGRFFARQPGRDHRLAVCLPWIIGFLLFTAGPMLFSLYTSFTTLQHHRAPRWIGLDNYEAICSPMIRSL